MGLGEEDLGEVLESSGAPWVFWGSPWGLPSGLQGVSLGLLPVLQFVGFFDKRVTLTGSSKTP